nr:GBF-interacting protein 1-like isoform X4 [Ipomoea batatas]
MFRSGSKHRRTIFFSAQSAPLHCSPVAISFSALAAAHLAAGRIRRCSPSRRKPPRLRSPSSLLLAVSHHLSLWVQFDDTCYFLFDMINMGANPLVLSTTASTPLVTQAAGLVQTSIVVPQPPLPIFRQPTAMHLPHYPPNYIPYGHYFSPFYPPPAIHQFFSNGAYPQQPQAGSVYQPPPAATTKYSLSQYKQGA